MRERTAEIGWSPELGDRICAGLSQGRVLRDVCKEVGILRHRYYQWRREHEAFRSQTELAREVGAHVLLDSALEIADNCPATPEGVRLAKLRIQMLMWLAGVLNPKRRDNKVEHAGEVTYVAQLMPGREQAGA